MLMACGEVVFGSWWWRRVMEQWLVRWWWWWCQGQGEGEEEACGDARKTRMLATITTMMTTRGGKGLEQGTEQGEEGNDGWSVDGSMDCRVVVAARVLCSLFTSTCRVVLSDVKHACTKSALTATLVAAAAVAAAAGQEQRDRELRRR